MLKTASKMRSFITLLGFFPFTILPLFFADWIHLQAFHTIKFSRWTGCLFPPPPWWCVPRMWTASLAAVLSSQPSVVCFFSEQLSLPAHTSGLPISSPENWTPSPVLEPAAWLCERVQEQPLNPINSFLGRPRREKQLQPGSDWVGKRKRVLRKRKSVTLAAEVGTCLLEKGQIFLSLHLYHFVD